ncbi:uncharacterized protein LDX57_005445 [Aspergillus melleus]|uniref:uncharacterized protein n=1 Tax=Aspergillus melleus TaxID=138277 RepID=UPI001E8DA114|nr:uncharacterized protein LDX57_005445 [Aspergillus melleus]KAH8427736.1 hypothetical protein LDX57_005445 [Aspergillus melleus]
MTQQVRGPEDGSTISPKTRLRPFADARNFCLRRPDESQDQLLFKEPPRATTKALTLAFNLRSLPITSIACAKQDSRSPSGFWCFACCSRILFHRHTGFRHL